MKPSFDNSDYPGLFQAADTESLSAQTAYLRCLSWFLILLILGSLANLIAGTTTAAAIVSALLFFSALLCSGLIAWKRFEKAWYSTRAVAESVKTITWRYMMRAEPYDADDQQAQTQFLAVLREILQENQHITKELCDELSGSDAISVQMSGVRATPLPDRLDFYLNNRVKEQGSWYLRKAQFNKQSGTKWFTVIVVLNALAIVCAVLRVGFSGWTYIPTDTFAVAAACAISWLQAKRFTELTTSYALTAHEINISRARSERIQTEAALSQFVNDTENAFSREHTQWAARRDAKCRTKP